eukprot:snap_masked-scaffold_9-processed-gene-2.48-mRNA-1 protein AED:1.00 eAED:1.00 QI:0/-1/0/0/-1/1/1/0/496
MNEDSVPPRPMSINTAEVVSSTSTLNTQAKAKLPNATSTLAADFTASPAPQSLPSTTQSTKPVQQKSHESIPAPLNPNEDDFVPGSVSKYERNTKSQLFVLFISVVLAVANCTLNFEVINQYEKLLDNYNALPKGSDLVQDNELNLEDVQSEFESESEILSGLCDVPFFIDLVQDEIDNDASATKDLKEPIQVALRFARASTFMATYFFVWVFLLSKTMFAFSILNMTFHNPTQNLERHPNATPGEFKEQRRRENKFFEQLNFGAKDHNIALETQDEKKIRIFLRSETVLFGFLQVVQDIPMFTVSILLVLFISQTRGFDCFSDFLDGEVGTGSDFLGAESVTPDVVFAQIAVILLHFGFHLGILGSRYIQLINHETNKSAQMENRKSTFYRLCVLSMWFTGYVFALLVPLFAVCYSKLGEEVLGVNTTDNDAFLVLTVFGSICMFIGFSLLMCRYGAQGTNKICVCLVVCEGCSLVGDAVLELESGELCCELCCC